MDGFLYTVPLEIRWRDLDPLGHVNNAVIVTYLELARVRLWQEACGLVRNNDFPFVIARVEVNYRRPLRLGDQAVVGVRLGRLGQSSFGLEYRIEVGGELAADAMTVQVHLDADRVRPAPMPPELRERLAGMVQQALGSEPDVKA